MMNIGKSEPRVTNFLFKKHLIFHLHFLFYRAGEERNRMKGRVVMVGAVTDSYDSSGVNFKRLHST